MLKTIGFMLLAAMLFCLVSGTIAADAGTCTATVQLNSGNSWTDNGIPHKRYDLTIKATGSCDISSVFVKISKPASALISSSWNINTTTGEITNFGNAIQPGSSFTGTGFIIAGRGKVRATIKKVNCDGCDNVPSNDCSSVDILSLCSDLATQFGENMLIEGDVDIIDDGSDEGICFLAHTLGGLNLPENALLNGLECKSQLCNYALFSTECSEGSFINLYEVMLPDIPGEQGEPSTQQLYVNALFAAGLDVAGVHFHWTGELIGPYNMHAIHHQNIGMDPKDFVRRTTQALSIAGAAINARVAASEQDQ